MKYKTKAKTLLAIKRQRKECSLCKTEKSFEEFHIYNRSADGRNSRCMECRNTAQSTRKVKGAQKLKTRVRADIERQRKLCRLCDTEKSFEDFGVNTYTVDGRNSHCVPCTATARRKAYEEPAYKNRIRESSYRRKYGISILDYNRILAAQGGGCAICESRTSGKRKLSVDHSHDSAIIRGILCSGCNTGLGGFKDSKENLLAAIKYLEKSEIS